MKRVLFLPATWLNNKQALQSLMLQLRDWPLPFAVLHRAANDPADAWYVSKKLAAMLGEVLVPTMPCPAERLASMHFSHTSVLAALQPGDLSQSLSSAVNLWPKAERWMLPFNPQSALGLHAEQVTNAGDVDRLLGLYPEEEACLNLMRSLLPVWVGAPGRLNHVA